MQIGRVGYCVLYDLINYSCINVHIIVVAGKGEANFNKYILTAGWFHL